MRKQIFAAVASIAVAAAMSVSAFAVSPGSTNGSGRGTVTAKPGESIKVIPEGVSGVEIDAPAGAFEAGTVIDVDIEPVSPEKAAAVEATIEEAFREGKVKNSSGKNVDIKSVNTVIDISAFLDGIAVQPNGEVEVTVSWDGKSNQVIYVGDNGEVEMMFTKVVGNVLTFTTTHFSDFYMVTVDPEDVVSDDSNGSTDGEDGDDKNMPTGVVLAVIPAAIAAAAIVVSKKRK